MPTRLTSHTAGSWFPSGYYGHYRSRVRVDFNNEYRQLARPQPPNRFLHRSSQPAATHQFSMHDNRHSFMNDASYFAQGLGKKRHPERSGVFDPAFVAWCPNKTNPRAGRPLTSTYRTDFHHRSPSTEQLLIQRPKTSFDARLTTTYRTAHGSESPNRDFINAMNNEALMLTSQSRQRQAKLKKSKCRETVASCLSWYKPRVPCATAVTDFDHMEMRPVPPPDQDLNSYPAPTIAEQQQQQQQSPSSTVGVCDRQVSAPTECVAVAAVPIIEVKPPPVVAECE